MSLHSTKQIALRSIVGIAISSLLAMITTPLQADEITANRISRTISFSQQAIPGTDEKNAMLKSADIDVLAPLEQQGYREESLVKMVHISSIESYQQTWVYDATTELIGDYDYDGFYHRFSVSIDADTSSDTAYIYARLYLSYEGGPWNLYASSNNYHIHGDSEYDNFIIETELADGFPAGYYDIRIELYDANYGDWLASYGPYDDASLSALPLEDSYSDDYPLAGHVVESQVVVARHGGALSWLLLLIPALVSFRRSVLR